MHVQHSHIARAVVILMSTRLPPRSLAHAAELQGKKEEGSDPRRAHRGYMRLLGICMRRPTEGRVQRRQGAVGQSIIGPPAATSQKGC